MRTLSPSNPKLVREVARALWVEDQRPDALLQDHACYREWTRDIMKQLEIRGFRLVRPVIRIEIPRNT